MTELSLVWRGLANRWECDEMGHMNVRFYLAKAGEGIEVFLHGLGHGRPGGGFVPREQHIRFHREVHGGTSLIGRAAVLSAADDNLRVYFELRRGFDEALVATIVADIEVGARRETPPISTMALPEEAQPKGLQMHVRRPIADRSEADRLGLVEIYRSAVQPNQVDRDGVLLPYHLIGMMADGILHLLVQLDPASAQGPRAAGIGGATLECRLIHRRPARVGDLVIVRSGVMAVTDKVQTFGHWILDLVTGEALATIEQVIIGFDVTSRKIVALPPDVRERMTAAIVPGLSA